MSAARSRLAARDYKNAGGVRHPGVEFGRYRQFATGLAIGLAVALLVWLYDHRAQPGGEDDLVETPAPQARAPNAVEDDTDPAEEYDFYDMLPRYEVTVPERDKNVRRDRPDQPVVQPGTYVLQVGSYQSRAEAERMRDKLAKLGIVGSLQHVTIDDDEWHRVRIGPMSDLDKLNETRRRLRAADIDALIYGFPRD